MPNNKPIVLDSESDLFNATPAKNNSIVLDDINDLFSKDSAINTQQAISASRSAGQQLANESDEIQENVKSDLEKGGFKKDPEWLTSLSKIFPTSLSTIWDKREMLSNATKSERDEIKNINNNIIAVQDQKAQIFKTDQGKKILFAEQSLRETQKKLADIKSKYEQAKGPYKQQLQSLYQNIQQDYNNKYNIYENTVNNSGIVGQNYKQLNEQIDAFNNDIDSKNAIIKQKANMFGPVSTIESMVNLLSTAMDDIQAQTYQFLKDDYQQNKGIINDMQFLAMSNAIQAGIPYVPNRKKTIEWLDNAIEENIAEKESAELLTLPKRSFEIDSFGDLMMAGYDEITQELPTLLGSSISLMAPAVIGIAGTATGNVEAGLLAGLSAQMISRYAESAAEASQTSKQAYDYLTLNHPEMSHEEKTIRALELGQANFKNNIAIGVKDIPEFLLAVMPQSAFLSRLGKGAKMTRYKEILATRPIIGNSVRYGGIMAAEGLEEGAQYLSNEYVQNYVRTEADKYDMSLSHVFSDKEFWHNVKGGAELGVFMSGVAHAARKIFSTDEPLTKKDIPDILNEQDNLKNKFIYKALEKGKEYWLTGTIRDEGKKSNGIFSDMSITDEAERIKDSKKKAAELIEDINSKMDIYESLKANKKINSNNRRLAYYNQVEISKLESQLELLEKAPEANAVQIQQVTEAIELLKKDNAEIGSGRDLYKQKASEFLQEIQERVKQDIQNRKKVQEDAYTETVQQFIKADIEHYSSFTLEQDGETAFNEAQRNLELLKANPVEFYKAQLDKLNQDNVVLQDRIAKAKSEEDAEVLTLELQKNEESIGIYNQIVQSFAEEKVDTEIKPVSEEKDVVDTKPGVPLDLNFLTQEDFDALNEATDNMVEPNEVTDLVVDLFNAGKINLDQLKTVNSFFTDKIIAQQSVKQTEETSLLTDEQQAAKQRFDEFINEILSQPTTDAELKKLLETNPVKALQDLIEWHKSQMQGKNQVTQQYHQNAIDKFQSLIDDYNLFTLKKELVQEESIEKIELFSGVYANAGQVNAIKKIIAFLNGVGDQFLLKGRGGTGKTTIIKKAIEGLPVDEVIGVTVADEARQVLQENMPNYKTTTIASLLGLVPDYNETTGEVYFRERNEEEESKFRSLFKTDPIERVKYIIVDEASMIDAETYNLLLLKKPKDAKIIFMGDNAQIPPINKNGKSVDSPVWQLQETEDFAELTERMRQGKESPILPITDVFAENIENIQNELPYEKNPLTERVNDINENGDGVQYVSNANEMIQMFVEDFKSSTDTKNAVIIAARNEVVDNINKQIRLLLFNTTEPFVKGDFIRVNSPFVKDGKVIMSNGLKGIVQDVEIVYNEDIDFTTYKITAEFDVINSNGKYQKVELTFETINPSDRKGFQAAYKKLAQIAKKYQKGTYEYQQAWKDYFNFKEKVVDIGYGYAITAHKVQGSTYNTAYVIEDDIMSFPGGVEQTNRMMYTAVSRPKNRLVIYNPTQDIKEKDQYIKEQEEKKRQEELIKSTTIERQEVKEEVVILTKEQEKEKRKQEIKERRKKAKAERLAQLKSDFDKLKATAGLSFKVTDSITAIYDSNDKKYKYYNKNGEEITSFRALKKYTYKITKKLLKSFFDSLATAEQKEEMMAIFERYQNAYQDVMALEGRVTLEYVIMETIAGKRFNPTDVKNNVIDINSRVWLSSEIGSGVLQGEGKKGWSVDVLAQAVMQNAESYGVGVQGFDETDIINMIYDIISDNPNGISNATLKERSQKENGLYELQQVEADFIELTGLSIEQSSDFLFNIQNELYNQNKIEVNEEELQTGNEVSVGENLGDTSVQEDVLSAEGNVAESEEGETDVTDEEVAIEDLEIYAREQGFSDLQHATFSWNKRLSTGQVTGTRKDVKSGQRLTTKEEIDQAAKGSESADRQREERQNTVIKESDNTYTGYKNGKIVAFKTTEEQANEAVYGKKEEPKADETKESKPSGAITKSRKQIEEEEKLAKEQTTREKVIDKLKAIKEAAQKRNKPNGSGTIALGGNVNLLADKILEKACDLAISFVQKTITIEDAILQMSDYIKNNIADIKQRFKQEIEVYNFFDNIRKDINESAKGLNSEHDFQTVQQASEQNVDNEQNFQAFTGDGENKAKVALGKINPLINNIPGLPLKKAHALLTKIASSKNWNGRGKFSDNFEENIAILYATGSLEERMLATRLQLLLEFDENINKEKSKKLERSLTPVEKQNRLVFLFNTLSSFKTHPIWTLFQREQNKNRSISMEITNAIDEIALVKQVKEKLEQMGNDTFVALYKELERKRQEYRNDNRLSKPATNEAILNAELAFLKDVTGLDFTDWLNRTAWLSYVDDRGVTHSFDTYMDLYKYKGSNSFLYNLIINKIGGSSGKYHTKTTIAPVPNKPHIKNFISELTYKSIKGKGNPINQLLAEKKKIGSAELAESYKNVKNKTKTASIMQSALRRKFDNIAKIAKLPFYENNEWVQFNKKGILYSLIEGIKNVPGNTGNSQRELTSNDLKSIMINAWLDGNNKSFMMPAGKLGDRDVVMMLNAKKYGENGKAKLAEIDPSITEEEIDEAVIQFINLNQSPLNADSYINGLTETKARQFVYDYFINKHFIDLFIHGRTNQYGKPGKVDASTDIVKRSASVSSSGTELNLTVEGGLGKTHNQIVISKIVAPDGTALADGQEFVTADHADRYQVSSGTDVSQPESIRWWHTIKDIVDYTTSKGKRFLSKTNKIVIDPLAEMDVELFNAENGTDYTIDNFDFDKHPDAKGLDYLAIYQFMKNNNADRLSTLDGVKFPIGKAVKLYKETVDEDGTVTMSIDRDVLKQKFEPVDAESEEAENAYNITHNNENIVVQQDLRNPGLAKESNESKQEYKNFIQFAEAEELAKINNRITAILTSELFEFLKDATPRELRNFLLNVDLDEIEDISEEDFEFDGNISKDLMKLGVDVLHPFNNKTAMTMFANRAGKEILGRKILKSLLVEVARLGIDLKEMRKEGNNVFLGEVFVPKSLGLRAHQFFATKEEMEAEVYENGKLKSKYNDFKGFEHEIREVDGKWLVPGEPVNVTRIPADAPHSHNMSRVAGYTPTRLKNIIITNTGAQRIAGPDFDGDQRHVQQFYKAKGEIVSSANFKRIANEKIAEKLKKKLAKVKDKKRIAQITKEVTDRIMNDMTIKNMSNNALYLKLKANYDAKNFDKWMDALDLKQADETFDKLKSRLKKYNKNNPLFFIDSDAKARVGLKVVGIGSLFIGNYNIANKIGANMINAIDFPNISIDANGNLTFGKAYKIKNFAKESKAMGNFLNLALDNLKELKIEILGLNDVTAKMYFTLLALRPQEIENQFKKEGMTESEAKDAAEKKWIDNVAGFFNHPMVQEWINAVRTNNDTGKTKRTPKQIINRLYDEFAPFMEYMDEKMSGKIKIDYEYDITMSPETLNTNAQTTQMQQQKANATIIKMIEKLNSIAGDLEVLQQAIKMTEYDGMPNTFTKYLLQKQAWNKLTSSNDFVKLRNLNTSMVKDSVYFASVLKAFEAFEAYINNNSLEMTKTGKEIFDLFREAKTSPEAMLISDNAFENATFMDKEIDAISRGIYNSALSIAIENNEEPAVTKKKVMDWFESLPEDNILANILSAEEKEVGDKVFKRVELAEAFRRNMSDDILNDAKNAFAELPENEKKLLLKYILNEFGGISTGTFTGNFSVLIDDNTHIEIGNKMREMFDKFNQNTNLAQDIYNRIIENDQKTKENIFDYVETIDEEGKKKRASYAGISGMAAKDYGQREVSNVAYENLKAGKELTTSTAFSKDDTMEYINKETGESFLAKITSVRKSAEKGKYIITVEETDKKAGEEVTATVETTEKALQAEIASSEEIAMADKLTPIEQNFADGQGGRKMQSQFKGKSTMDLIISGDRTRTTRANTDIQRMARDYGLSKISDLIGKVVRMTDKQGRQVYTRITNVAPFTQEYQDATWQQEGWAKDVTDSLVGKYPYAIEFKVVSAPQATTEGKVSDVDQEFNDLMNEWNQYKDELMKKDPDMAFEHWAMMSAEERKKMIDCL
jgi:hypothetical protein